jgi:hypothetical protein
MATNTNSAQAAWIVAHRLVSPAGTMSALATSLTLPVGSTPPPPSNVIPLLVDRGADITCISPQVAHGLGLKSLGLGPANIPSGQALSNRYLVDVGIPFIGQAAPAPGPVIAQTFTLQSVTVMEYNGGSPHYQGLLGRDILCLGYFPWPDGRGHSRYASRKKAPTKTQILSNADNPEQSSRFIDMAREVEADETPGVTDRAFNEVVRRFAGT